MKPEPGLEKIREDFQARQNNILWEDSQENARRMSASLWKPNAKSRPSAAAFAIFFLLLAVGIFAIPFLTNFEGGSVVAFFVALGPLFLSVKLFSRSFSSRRMRGSESGKK